MGSRSDCAAKCSGGDFFGFLLSTTRPGLSRWRFDIVEAKSLAKKVAGVSRYFFTTIYLKIDQVMLKILIGDGAVGVYAVAATISGRSILSLWPLRQRYFRGLLNFVVMIQLNMRYELSNCWISSLILAMLLAPGLS